jgi:hypothetical protein
MTFPVRYVVLSIQASRSFDVNTSPSILLVATLLCILSLLPYNCYSLPFVILSGLQHQSSTGYISSLCSQLPVHVSLIIFFLLLLLSFHIHVRVASRRTQWWWWSGRRSRWQWISHGKGLFLWQVGNLFWNLARPVLVHVVTDGNRQGYHRC